MPKGSFYDYFASQEELAREVIRNYANYFAPKLADRRKSVPNARVNVSIRN